MLELEEARSRILAAIPVPASETVSIRQASGRFLTRTVHAPIDLPPFNNSAMDGYAVRASDVATASCGAPVRLHIAGKVAAGERFSGEVAKGECVRLFTGSPVPAGADAVVMQEDTQVDSENPSQVLVFDSVKPGESIRLRGEDVGCGSVIVAQGEQLGFGQVSVLAAAGVAEVDVGKRPRVAILSTGTELKEPGEPLEPGQIYESNRLGLEILVQDVGGLPVVFPLVKDALEPTTDALERALETSDLVVTSGGASVGELDLLKPAFQQIGGTLDFWKVSMKPGRPFVFGQRRGKLLFGLPGNPVSALVTFLLLVRPALLRWQGAEHLELSAYAGMLAEPLSNTGNRRHFLRVRVDHEGKVWSAGAQASHMLRALSRANGLVDLSPETELTAGSEVGVLRWD